MGRFAKLGFAALAIAFLAAPASAITWTDLGTCVGAGIREYEGEDFDLAASVKFERGGVGFEDYLRVTLTNTSAVDVTKPAGVLAAVFFDFSSGPAGSLNPLEAWMPDSGTILNPGTSNNGIGYDTSAPYDEQFLGGGAARKGVGGEFAYVQPTTGGPTGAVHGISASGFSIFGNPNFAGIDLSPPAGVDGLNYGIVSAGDDPTTGNTPLTNRPLIKNSVIFTFSGLGTGDVVIDKDAVGFQYGTSLDEPFLRVVPEPSAIYALAVGIMGLGASAQRWRRRRS